MSASATGGRIDSIFAGLRAGGRKALMPFITGGYPTLEATAEVLPALQSAGASIVEIGIPFSDPIADGPVIAGSMHEALLSGTTPEKLFDLVSAARPHLDLGLVAMVSQSIVERMGGVRFVADAAEAGFDGVIVPDLDLATAARLRAAADERGVSFTLLVAPTTADDRLREIVRLCSGFVYLLARAGLTGEQDHAPEIADRVATIRAATDVPIAAGFGISNAEHVSAVTAHADAAIVGSALVRRMAEADDPVAAAATFVADLARGLPA